MQPHPRIRKTIKWGGLALGVVVVVAAALSRTTYYSADLYSTRSIHSLTVTAGTLSYMRIPTGPARPDFYDTIMWIKLPLPVPQLHWSFDWTRTQVNTFVRVPLWLPALVSLLASGFAWRLDTLATRRLKLGACPTCSYSRTGLTPFSPCPECGAAAPQA